MKPKVIVIGAGYAGISFLKSLKAEIFTKADFTIISKNSYHYHSTMLHKIATAEKSGRIMFEMRAFLPSLIKIKQEKVTAIKPKFVITENGTYPYDYLVCAAGFVRESYDLAGIQNAMFIDSYRQAAGINEAIKVKFDEFLEGKPLRIAVCGGGMTGVEFVASLADMLRDRCAKYGANFKNIEISLINSKDRVLTMYSKNLSQKAAAKLQSKGVKLVFNSRITSLEKGRINLENSHIDADLIIWTAGVKGSDLVSGGEVKNSRGRVSVDKNLRSANEPNQFYVGDVAAFQNGDHIEAPTAQIAVEMGEYLAREFEAILGGKKFDEEFKFKTHGSICSIGKGYAVANIMGRELSGYLPYLIKTIVEKKWNVKLLGLKGIVC